MKKTFQKVICAAMILSMALPFAACGNKDEIWSTETTSPEDRAFLDPDATTITFGVPMFCHFDVEHLKLFNEELLKDGHKYQLKISGFEYDFEDTKYFENIENALKGGTVDVAFLGMGDENNSTYNLINSGAVLKLDEILSSDKGKALYEAFPSALWEAGKCNGHIYSIPQANLDDQGIYAAFNKKYISDEAIENWDGTIDGLYKIIKDVKWNDTAAPRFQYLISDYDFESIIRCEIKNSLLYDFDTMTIQNPLESDKFINYFKVLEQMKADGYLAESVSYYQNTSYIDNEAYLSSGNYLVALSSGEPDEYFYKENICIKKLTPYLPARVNTSIGISCNTEKLDAVLDFLGLFYGEEKYCNLLLYGKQDVDYKLVDGFAVKMDGTELPYDFTTKLSLGLFVNTHPVVGENFTSNRKEEYFALYKNAKPSPFIGFIPDSSKYSSVQEDLKAFLNSLNKQSLDQAIKEYSVKLKADGIDDYVSSVRKQWESYKNNL